MSFQHRLGSKNHLVKRTFIVVALTVAVAVQIPLDCDAFFFAPKLFPFLRVKKQSLLIMPPLALMAAGVLKDEAPPTGDIPRFYPIGTPGTPWTEVEDLEWRAQTKCQRSYQTEVLNKLETTLDKNLWTISQYGALSHNPEKYPLMVVHSKEIDKAKPTILVTGGVHGYETSGVQGAILFLQTINNDLLDRVNIIVAPCVSPWAYEHIQRWNHDLLDPNRSFAGEGSTEESQALIAYLKEKVDSKIACHLDLHETTDTDASEFMPAKHAKAGMAYEGETIPDGFYLVGNDQLPQMEFQKAVIANVKKVTHIAPPDDNGEIIEVPVTEEGIILVPTHELGLCCSLSGADYCTTTEVYPDSPKATDIICNQAQVAAIVGAIDYISSK